MIIFIAEITEAWLNPGLSGTYPWYENLISLSLFLGAIGLVLAWRWKRSGSILSIVCVITNYEMYITFGGQGRGLYVVPVILLPVLIPGILFLISWLRTDSDTSPRFA